VFKALKHGTIFITALLVASANQGAVTQLTDQLLGRTAAEAAHWLLEIPKHIDPSEPGRAAPWGETDVYPIAYAGAWFLEIATAPREARIYGTKPDFERSKGFGEK
jgi:hypothetical protein